MAQEVFISGGPERAKIRNPIGVAVLCFVTIFIYLVVWWYKINREMADLGKKHGRTDLGTNPTLSMLAIFPGFLLIVPVIWTTVTTYQRAKRAQQMVGVLPGLQLNPWLYGVAYVAFSPAAYGYLQDGLNKVWLIDGGLVPQSGPYIQPSQAPAPPPPPPGSVPAPPPPPAPADTVPPPPPPSG